MLIGQLANDRPATGDWMTADLYQVCLIFYHQLITGWGCRPAISRWWNISRSRPIPTCRLSADWRYNQRYNQPIITLSRPIIAPTELWVCQRQPILHNLRPILRRVGQLSISSMFNISPPTESPDGNPPTGISRFRQPTVDPSSGYGPEQPRGYGPLGHMKAAYAQAGKTALRVVQHNTLILEPNSPLSWRRTKSQLPLEMLDSS